MRRGCAALGGTSREAGGLGWVDERTGRVQGYGEYIGCYVFRVWCHGRAVEDWYGIIYLS